VTASSIINQHQQRPATASTIKYRRQLPETISGHRVISGINSSDWWQWCATAISAYQLHALQYHAQISICSSLHIVSLLPPNTSRSLWFNYCCLCSSSHFILFFAFCCNEYSAYALRWKATNSLVIEMFVTELKKLTASFTILSANIVCDFDRKELLTTKTPSYSSIHSRATSSKPRPTAAFILVQQARNPVLQQHSFSCNKLEANFTTTARLAYFFSPYASES